MPTRLLNDDGTASMATMLMTSHHAFRRDLAAFARALVDAPRASELADEWTRFREGLHHHHTIEDTTMFPDFRTNHPDLAGAIERLEAQHHAIDPLLARGDAAFAELATRPDDARAVVAGLLALLDEHLELEERTVIPLLRDIKQFPVAPNDEAMAMYAQGFAWSTAGLDGPVVERILDMLPAGLVAKFPAARAELDARSRRVWGYTHTGASTTSVPEPR